MLKLEQGKKTSNAARQHKGLHVIVDHLSLSNRSIFIHLGHVGIFKYLFESSRCQCKSVPLPFIVIVDFILGRGIRWK